MYIRFSVIFPDKLDADVCAKLSAVLPPSAGPSEQELEDAEECSSRTVKEMEEELKQRAQHMKGSAAYNSDSDDEGGGPRVQCAQQ